MDCLYGAHSKVLCSKDLLKGFATTGVFVETALDHILRLLFQYTREYITPKATIISITYLGIHSSEHRKTRCQVDMHAVVLHGYYNLKHNY